MLKKSVDSRRGAAVCAAVASLFLFCHGWDCLAQANPSAPAYRERFEGDVAMSAKDYSTAASLYSQYRVAAERSGDKNALEDALERLVDALVLAGHPDKAGKAFDDLERLFPESNPEAKELWRSEILLLEGKSKESSDALERQLAAMQGERPERQRMQFCLGMALERQGEFKKAAAAYSECAKIGKDAGLGIETMSREVLCLASAKDTAAANDALLSFPALMDDAGKRRLRLLGIATVLKSQGIDAALPAYASAMKDMDGMADQLACEVAMAMGDAASDAKEFDRAAEFYNDALEHAAGNNDACGCVSRMLAALVSAGRLEEAADLALKQLKLFGDGRGGRDLKLQTARLLAQAGRSPEAVALYTGICGDKELSRDGKISAVKECARTQVDVKDFAGAERTVRKFLSGDEDIGEASFMLAEILAKQGRNREAADAYMVVAASHKTLRDKALYEGMRAFMDAGELDKALAAAEQILKEFETGDIRKDALYLRAVTLEMKGERGEALKEYLKFAENYPNHPEFTPKAIYRAARISYLDGRLKDAERLFYELVQRHPSDPLSPAASYWRICALEAEGSREAAEKETWQFFERRTDSEFAIKAVFDLAARQSDAGAFSKAEETVGKLMEKLSGKPDASGRALYEKAMLAAKGKRPDDALKLLGELYEKYPESQSFSDACFLHGEILKDQGEYGQALGRYQKAMERRPGSLLEAAALGNAGDCQFSMFSENKDKKSLDSALESYRCLMSLKDAPAQLKDAALFKAGRCLELVGDLSGAMESYKTLIYRSSASEALGEASSLWTVKAAEAVSGVATQHPTPENVNDARTALEWLHGKGFIGNDELSLRLKSLNKLKLRK